MEFYDPGDYEKSSVTMPERSKCSVVKSLTTAISKRLPAAIVSPFRLNNILPMSLFTENGSIGIDTARAEGFDIVPDRSDICTFADMFFVKTLQAH